MARDSSRTSPESDGTKKCGYRMKGEARQAARREDYDVENQRRLAVAASAAEPLYPSARIIARPLERKSLFFLFIISFSSFFLSRIRSSRLRKLVFAMRAAARWVTYAARRSHSLRALSNPSFFHVSSVFFYSFFFWCMSLSTEEMLHVDGNTETTRKSWKKNQHKYVRGGRRAGQGGGAVRGIPQSNYRVSVGPRDPSETIVPHVVVHLI